MSVVLQPLHMANFSSMYAARPAGESLSAKPTECGRVAENKDVEEEISK